MGDQRKLLFADYAPEPVGAKNQEISILQRDGVLRSVGREFTTGTESRSEDMALWVGLGVFGAHNSVFNQAADVGMISRQTGCALASDQVEAAVADMRKKKLSVDNCQRCASGAHAAELRMFEGIALNRVVCGLQAGAQAVLRVAAEVVIVDVADGLDGETAGFQAAFVSAHAVGDDGKTPFAAKLFFALRLPIQKGVFVVGAEQADIGQACCFQSWLRIGGINRHK